MNTPLDPHSWNEYTLQFIERARELLSESGSQQSPNYTELLQRGFHRLCLYDIERALVELGEFAPEPVDFLEAIRSGETGKLAAWAGIAERARALLAEFDTKRFEYMLHHDTIPASLESVA
jgi:hypothetical protein